MMHIVVHSFFPLILLQMTKKAHLGELGKCRIARQMEVDHTTQCPNAYVLTTCNMHSVLQIQACFKFTTTSATFSS
jgi:hypothetical protein